MSRALTDHIASSFREDAPRPPVPGEEGDAPCYPGKVAMMRPLDTAKSIFLKSFGSSARRNEDGLGEPEGSASPDSPPSRWTKSLHSLLGDQDGALLFRTFLEREKFVDTLDFWFACNGFRQMDLKDNKTQRVAKAIYKRYIENNGIVAKQLKPATKTFIRDNLKKIDSAMFDQAQTEIQITMEDTSYQMFLTSDIYLEYVRTGGENPSHVNPNGLCDLKVVCGYLPTLNEEEEWSCDFKAKTLVGLSSKALRATVSMRAVEAMDKAYGPRMYPYHVGSRAPAASTNDSEVSSDALTDDAMSVTDSVDGIPPYKMGSKKQLQREVQRNLRMNSQVSLPSFPCTRRPPKEMVPVEPTEFAAQLISRLQRLKKEQDTRSSLEERLQQIQEEEEREDAAETPGSAPHPLALLPGSSEDDPQAILDEHLSRVLKTPGCQSPTVLRHSPPSRSPERRVAAFRGASTRRALLSPGTSGALALGPSLGPLALVSRQSTKYIHHHYIHHHHTGPKSKEQIEREAALRVQGLCSGAGECQPCVPYQRSRSLGREKCGAAAVELNNSGRSSSLSRHTCHSGAEDGVAEGCPEESAPLLHLPADTADRSQNVWQWMLESERQGRHRSHSSTQITKKSFGGGQTHTWGGGGSSSHLRNHQPAHPFVQDPAMPPLPPPNTLAQLEEARRRLQEVSTKPPKQRHSMSSPQRDKSHLVPVQSGGGVAVASPNPITASPLVPGSVVQSEETKEDRKCSVSPGAAAPCSGETVVTYFFCGEEIPYRRSMKSHRLTLGHFKEQLRKKGNYRYYFKKASDEFECGAVFEEVSDDGSLLPTYEGKILGKVERME